MAFYAADRVKVTTTTTGTSDFGLGPATSGAFQSFSDADIPDESTVHYSAFTETTFECGEGVYDSDAATLSRDTIFASSNNGSIVNFNDQPTVIVTFLAETMPVIARVRLGEDTIFFVDAGAGNDTTGLGTLALPWQTINHALEEVYEHYDAGGYSVTIRLAAGTYDEHVLLRPIVGGYGIIEGDLSSPATWDNAIITMSEFIGNDRGIIDDERQDAGYWIIRGVLLETTFDSSPQFGNLIKIGGGTSLYCYDFVLGATGSGSYSQVYCDNGFVQLGEREIRVGGGWSYVYANGGNASIALNFGAIATLTGTPNYEMGFVMAGSMGQVYAYSTYTGTATGPRFQIYDGGGIIGVAGSDLEELPGNAAGDNFGGWYNSDIPGTWRWLAGDDISGSPASIEFEDLGDYVSDALGWTKFRIELIDVRPATDNQILRARIGTGGTPTYQTTNYNYAGFMSFMDDPGPYDQSAASQAQIDLTQQCGNANNETTSAIIEFTLGHTNINSKILWKASGNFTNSSLFTVSAAGEYVGAQATAIRLYWSTGNFANVGAIRIYGLRGPQ